MSRTLEPGISLLTAAEIRVVVVPIGPMPRDTFESYLEALNVHRHVPLNATAPFHKCGAKSPFPHLPFKTGAMHFRFMQAEDARRRSRVSDLHIQRNAVAVLGLLHCPLVEDLTAAHSEFGRTVRQWPEALVARCAAFEPSPAHLALPTAKLQDLMIFPAGHLDQHLEVYMHEFAAAVLSAIEDHLLNANVSSIKLNTYVDSGEFLGSLVQMEDGLRKLNIHEEEVKEKKRWGRLQKSKGDWSLLVGSPKDAFEHYKSAMDLSRAAGDAIWFGAAVEGLAHARVLEALLTARLAASSGAGAHGRPGCNRGNPAATPSKAALAAVAAAAAAGSPVRDGPGAAAGGAAVGGAGVAAAAGDGVCSSGTDGSAAARFSAAEATGDSNNAAADAVSSASPFAASAAVEGAADDPATEPAAAAAAQEVSGPPVDESSTMALAADSTSSSAAAGRASSLPAMPPPASPTAAAATAAAAAQLARRRSVGSAAAALQPNYSLSGHGFCVMLASADLEGEVRELLAEAKNWYRKKGGALPLQIEQSIKLCRFLACTAAGTAAIAAGSAAAAPVVEALKTQLKSEVDAAVGFILENLASLSLMEDKAVALAEASQLLGLAGCGRKRLLLLWAALDLVRTGGSGAAAVAAGSGVTPGELGPAAGAAVDVWGLLRLSLAAMEPPDQPGQQDPDDVLKVHWSLKRFISWQQQHMQEAAAAAPRTQQQQQQQQGSTLCSGSTVVQQAQQPWQQQQFQQLLGPQLALLTAVQAAALGAPCLLQQMPTRQRPPGSPSKLGLISSNNSLAGMAGALNEPAQHQLQHAGLTVPIGVLAGLLNPCNNQQWMPGGGGLWDSLQVALLEVLVNAARAANAPVDAWEGAATLLREYYPLLPQALQSFLMETLSACGAAMGTRQRCRPGPGPGPQVQLKRVVPGPACLQPQYLSAALSGNCGVSSSSSSNLKRTEGAAGSGPFIFDPHAAKRKAASAAAAAQAAIPEWVCGEEGRVEVVLVNTCATPLNLDGLQLQVQHQQQQQQRQPAGPQRALNLAASATAVPPAEAVMGAAAVGTCDGSGLAANQPQLQQQQQQRSVSVKLAAGSKPVRVLLSHVPNKAGPVAVTGVQAMCKGVSWHQPFVQLLPAGGVSSGGATAAVAAVVAAAGGRDQARPQGCFTVVVQPQLPLIKASLQGPEVQVTLPSEEDLSAFTNPTTTTTTTSSSSSTGPPPGSGGSSWSSAAVYSPPPAGAAAAGGASGGSVGADLEKKAAVVVVFEGQTLGWTLTLTNISTQPITGCKVTVLRLDAKGAVQKGPTITGPPGAQLPSPILTGAVLEVDAQGLHAGLPLGPGASLALPVRVVVGKPPGSYDASTLQVCITYHGTATSAVLDSSSSSQILGRSLTVPIRLAIQPTLQVKSIRFLQQGLPLRNGSRDNIILSKPQQLLLQSLRESRDTAAAGPGGFAGSNAGTAAAAGGGLSGGSRRGTSHHIRNNSEGSLPVAGVSVGPMMLLPPGTPSKSTAAAAAAAAAAAEGAEGSAAAEGMQQPGHLSSIPSGVGIGSFLADDSSAAAAAAAAPTAAVAGKPHGVSGRHGSSAAAAAAAAAAGGSLALSSQPVLELAVRNASERYFRTWLGCLPDRLSADKALSAVAVLEPGDQEKLAAVVPLANAAAAVDTQQQAAASDLHTDLMDPPRLAAAEVLVGRLVVCWEMITGAAAAGVLPHGCVLLAPLDVAANLTPVALSGLCPSPLHLRLSVPHASAVPASQAPGHMSDLSALMASSSSSSSRSSVACGRSSTAGGSTPAGLSHTAGVGALNLPGVCGPPWGLHMKVGQYLAFDLEVSYAASGASGSNSNTSQPPQLQQLDLQVTLFASDALTSSTSSSNSVQLPGTPTTAAAAGDKGSSGYVAALLSGQSLGPRSFAAAAGSGQGTPKAAETALRNGNLQSALPAASPGSGDSLIDPGVLLTGCYNRLQVAVTPGGRHTCRLHALLVQPGLYVLGVADVQQVQGPAGDAGSTAAAATGKAVAAAVPKAAPSGVKWAADSAAPTRVYYNQDRLYVLVTR